MSTKDEAASSGMSRTKGVLGVFNTYLRRNRVGEILVSRKKLTPFQLKEALNLQKEQKVPLGRVLLLQGFISPRELRLTLLKQSSLRTILTLVTVLSSLTLFSSRQVIAENLRDIPRSISIAFGSVSANSIAGEIGQRSALFGTGERVSTDLSSFTKWSSMFDRFSREVNNTSADGAIQKWRRDLSSLRGLPLEQMVDEVNNMMNKVRYIGDKRNWGKSDYWETPVEFLTYGGDCEDFAIAKYVSLKALGVPDNAMRITIVKDLQKGVPHAILVVYLKEGPVVLDNQIKQMTEASRISTYKPIFSINRSAWWLHTERGDANPTQIASASR